MSTNTEVQEPKVPEADTSHEPPSDLFYVKIALALAVLTAIEVAISYVERLEGGSGNVILLIMAAVKFAVVAMFFMHLKYEPSLLKKTFVGGIILAIVCYVGYLLTLHAWA